MHPAYLPPSSSTQEDNVKKTPFYNVGNPFLLADFEQQNNEAPNRTYSSIILH